MKSVLHILDRLISGADLGAGELAQLKELLSTPEGRHLLEPWLAAKWEKASGADVELKYDLLHEKIANYETSLASKKISPVRRFLHQYQRVAAILLIPALLVPAIMLFSLAGDERVYTAEAPWGEKARVELPDGSKVLLNAGSKISYTSGFDRKDRRISLSGEAYFEVEKNKGKPFIVSTPHLDVTVTGTKFNVNAYEDEPSVIASLVEGGVKVTTVKSRFTYDLTPGRSLVLSKASGEISFVPLDQNVSLAWKDNRLVFVHDDIASLAKKIEKWYGVAVNYDPKQFEGSRFNVRLMEGERLDNLLDIIEQALNARCTIKDDTLIISRKKPT